MRFKNLDSLEAGEDLPTKTGDVSLQWTKNIKLVPPDEKVQFVDYLKRQTQLFEVLNYLIQERYRIVSDRQFDFTNPNVKDSMLYHEGYKQALRDIHKLLP